MGTDLLTVSEAAERLRVSFGFLKRHIAAGHLPGVLQTGGGVRISWVAVWHHLEKYSCLLTCDVISEGERIERSRLYQQKDDTRYATQVAIKRGLIRRGPCAICGATKVHAHHNDYSDPYDITWLCPDHHYALHWEQRRKARAA